MHHTVNVARDPLPITARELAARCPDELTATLEAVHTVAQALQAGDDEALAAADRALAGTYTAMLDAAQAKAPST